MKQTLVCISLLFTLVSCVSGPKIDTFMLDGGIQQLFIRPSRLESGILATDVDFTVQAGNDVITNVVVNFSVSGSKDAILSLESAQFAADNGLTLKLEDITPLFIDRNANQSRYGSTMSPEDFLLLIQQEKPSFRVVLRSKTFEFKPTPPFLAQLRGAETQFVF